MRSLQASTSNGGVGISSVAPPPRLRPRHSRVIVAKVEPSEKSVEIMRKFSEQYARKSGTYFCVDKGVTSVVIKGLADHKDSLGAPLCPCRHYDDKAAEAGQGFWNCPCVPMRERKECHCMLFLTPDNDFAGQEQSERERMERSAIPFIVIRRPSLHRRSSTSIRSPPSILPQGHTCIVLPQLSCRSGSAPPELKPPETPFPWKTSENPRRICSALVY